MITGGLGFIGSRLACRLRERGYHVVVCDKAVMDRRDYVRADVTRYEELLPIFRKYDIKGVFHLAGEVGRVNGEQFPRRCIEINESGTVNLAQLCLDFDAVLVFASTSEIYGNLGDTLLTEDLWERMPLCPTNVYGLSKLHAENYLKHFCDDYGLKAAGLRFFMCYGDGERPDPYRSAMANFVWNALNDRPLTVHEGTWRGWCYIDDIVDGCIKVMEHSPFERYEPFNVGKDDLRPMEEVARLICRLAGKSEDLIRVVPPPKKLLSPVKRPSFEKASRMLGFEAKVSLEEGIARTVEWQKKLLQGSRKNEVADNRGEFVSRQTPAGADLLYVPSV